MISLVIGWFAGGRAQVSRIKEQLTFTSASSGSRSFETWNSLHRTAHRSTNQLRPS